MDIASEVAGHYSLQGLEAAVVAAIKALGKDPERLTTADLRGADEFHFGWHPATVAFGAAVGLAPGEEVLDIGCGIGGPARYFAEAHGCLVTGIDLSFDFLDAATGLTRRCGLAERVKFHLGDAHSLPFADASFDAATLIHVGMNIDDKGHLFAEVRRVLRTGGRFGVYDIMRTADGKVRFPVHWAETPRTSFLESPRAYRQLLEARGFEIESQVDRREMVLKIARIMARDTNPADDIHTAMGPVRTDRRANVMAALRRGTIAPIELIARAV
jgi:ubiquinone/menaquinone biosynthesis C-methylase UbiE